MRQNKRRNPERLKRHLCKQCLISLHDSQGVSYPSPCCRKYLHEACLFTRLIYYIYMSVSVCVYACVRACVRVLLLFSCKLIGDFLALFRDCDDSVKDSIASALQHSRREGEKTYDRRTCQEKKLAALDLAQAGSCCALEDEAQAQEDGHEDEQRRAVLRMRSRQRC